MTLAPAGRVPRPDDLLALAVQAALAAGRLIVDERPAGRLPIAATKSSVSDIVTVMDQRAEALLEKVIGAARPDDGFLGEEGAVEFSDAPGGVVGVQVDEFDGHCGAMVGDSDQTVGNVGDACGDAGGACVHARSCAVPVDR